MQRATNEHGGSLFIGIDLGVGGLTITPGYQLSWDAGGWITSSGPTVRAEEGGYTGQAGIDLVNNVAFAGELK